MEDYHIFSVVDVLEIRCIVNNAVAYQHTIFFYFLFVSVSCCKNQSKLFHNFFLFYSSLAWGRVCAPAGARKKLHNKLITND